MAEEVMFKSPSSAVMVFAPAVLSVVEKVPTPLVRVAEAGSPAAESLEVMETVPVYPVAVLPDASLAVTVKLKAVPATAEAGTEARARVAAELEETVMLVEVMERDPSDAVRDLVPTVFNLTAKEPTPFARVAAFGRVAAESLEEMATVPVYPVAMLPDASLAVTVMLKVAPAMELAGMEVRTREFAEAGLMVMVALLEIADPERVAPRVTEPEFTPVKLAV